MAMSGASFDQIVEANAVGFAAGMVGAGAVSAALGKGAPIYAQMIGGATSSVMSKVITTAVLGGKLGSNDLLVSAISGAVVAGIAAGLRGAAPVSQQSDDDESGIRTKGGKHRVDIQQLRHYRFPDTDAAAGRRYEVEMNRWANKAEILQALTRGNSGDIVTFFGHSNVNPDTGEVLGVLADSWFSETDKVSVGEIVSALGADESTPSVVVMGGCKSEAMLGQIVNTGVPVAIGFTDNIPWALGARATDVVMSTLLKGGTIEESIEAANATIDASQLGTMARATVQVSSGVDIHDSLVGNGL
jgi:hypothetical protein